MLKSTHLANPTKWATHYNLQRFKLVLMFCNINKSLSGLKTQQPTDDSDEFLPKF